MSLSLGQFAKLAATSGNPAAGRRASALLAAAENAPGKDHLRLTVAPVENGFRLRLEMEPGVVPMIKVMHEQ